MVPYLVLRDVKTDLFEWWAFECLKLQFELEAEIWKKRGESEIYMDFNTYYQCGDWMVQQVTNATTNLLSIYDFVYKVPRGQERSEE